MMTAFAVGELKMKVICFPLKLFVLEASTNSNHQSCFRPININQHQQQQDNNPPHVLATRHRNRLYIYDPNGPWAACNQKCSCINSIKHQWGLRRIWRIRKRREQWNLNKEVERWWQHTWWCHPNPTWNHEWCRHASWSKWLIGRKWHLGKDWVVPPATPSRRWRAPEKVGVYARNYLAQCIVKWRTRLSEPRNPTSTSSVTGDKAWRTRKGSIAWYHPEAGWWCLQVGCVVCRLKHKKSGYIKVLEY